MTSLISQTPYLNQSSSIPRAFNLGHIRMNPMHACNLRFHVSLAMKVTHHQSKSIFWCYHANNHAWMHVGKYRYLYDSYYNSFDDLFIHHFPCSLLHVLPCTLSKVQQAILYYKNYAQTREIYIMLGIYTIMPLV